MGYKKLLLSSQSVQYLPGVEVSFLYIMERTTAITNTLFTEILLHVDRFTLSFCLLHSYGLYRLTNNLNAKFRQAHCLKYTLVNCHHDLRDRENSYILLYFPLTILPSANSCRYWGTERRKNVRAEACNTFTLLFSHLRDANPKFTF